jgi:peptidoglycan/xylan/chitin deacetylase (PgdA/CDA1 family)
MKSFTTLAASALLAGLVTAHPQVGMEKRLAKGQYISSCTNKDHVALTFDDGPYDYTVDLINKLEAAGHKATFFVNGQNYGNIYDPPAVAALQRMIAGNHQVASHTWSHAYLTKLDAAGIKNEMDQVEVALTSIIGRIPTYMRPPYLDYNDAVLSTLGTLGYSVIGVDIDTLDWQYDSINPATSEGLYQSGYEAGGTISLNHDPEPITVSTVVPWIIAYLKTKGKTSVTVGECLGDPAVSTPGLF